MKTILLAVVLLVGLHAIAQSGLTDSLRDRIDSLESALKEKNYSRIPIGDFDKTLDVRVHSEMYSLFYKYLAVLGLILFGGGFGLYRSLQGELKKNVEDAVKDKIESLREELKELNATLKKQQTDFNDSFTNKMKDLGETQNRENSRQDVLIKTISDNISSLSAKQETYLSEVSANVEKKILEATRVIWNDIADNKLRTAEASNYTGALLAKELNEFLENPSVKINTEKKQRLIDAMMRCFYYTSDADLKTNAFDSRYNEMTKLLKKYEGNVELLPATYANAAIAFNNIYEYYGKAEDKNFCIDCCDKALLKSKDYGIPFALKLEVYAMDYLKAFNQGEKDESREKLLRIFHEINNNQSVYLPIDTLARLSVDRGVKYLKRYIELLESVCPDEMLTIKEKACRNIISTSGEIKSETSKKLFFGLLEEGAKKYTGMSGLWKSRKSINAGIETPAKELNNQITLDNYKYWIADTDTTELGYIHFLPYSDRPVINLYALNDEGGYLQTVLCISSIDVDGVWTLCSNYNQDDQRPADFSSTIDNGYVLDEYVKQ